MRRTLTEVRTPILPRIKSQVSNTPIIQRTLTQKSNDLVQEAGTDKQTVLLDILKHLSMFFFLVSTRYQFPSKYIAVIILFGIFSFHSAKYTERYAI